MGSLLARATPRPVELPPLRRGTRATVGTFYQIGKDGRLHVVVILKQRFGISWNGDPVPIPGAEIRAADELWDENCPEESSIKFASDLCLSKTATDIVVHGSAQARGGATVTELDVFVRVGPVERALKVFGPRTWTKTMGGVILSPPQPFDSLSLRWEYAYGGSDFTDDKKPLQEARNPVGRGLARSADKLADKPGPQIEDPTALLKNHRQSPTPAGLFPVGRHWEPRRSFAGTMDDAWRKERMPIPPFDFDDRFNQIAPLGLIAPGFLRGGEAVEVLGMNEKGALRFVLPRRAYYTGAVTAAGAKEYRNQLDTVVLFPNDEAVELTWRSAIPVRSRIGGIREIQVHDKERR
ncbi:MAG: DUF2169 domain-containing protein [Myxococcota bacterium]